MLSFAPDAIDIAPEALQAVSAVPTIRGYKTPPAGVDLGGDQFSGTPQGGAFLLGLTGSYRTFVGTSTYVYEYSSGTWTDRSRAGNYTAGAARWRFAQFGDTELAINKATQLQQSSTGAFSNVSNAPKASCIEVCAGFVLVANCDDTSTGLSTAFGDQPHRWWCSQIFNPTGTWAPDVSKQCVSGLLVETPGAINSLKRLAAECVAYKSKSIYVGSYVGGAAVWQWRCVSTDVGCPAPEGVVTVGNTQYFIGESDFYAFNGSQTQPIGALIKDWFFSRLSRANISSVQTMHDRSAKIIYWIYPVGSSSSLTSVICYHYDSQRWGAFDLSVLDVLETVTDAITYESLGNLYSTYDDIPAIAYDSPFWTASTPVLAYLSPTSYLTSLSGTASQMTLTTGWNGSEDVISLCKRVRPRFRSAPTAGTLTHQTLMTLGDTPTSVAGTSTMHDGRFDVLRSARYHRFALTLSGSCEVEAVVPTLVQQGLE